MFFITFLLFLVVYISVIRWAEKSCIGAVFAVFFAFCVVVVMLPAPIIEINIPDDADLKMNTREFFEQTYEVLHVINNTLVDIINVFLEIGDEFLSLVNGILEILVGEFKMTSHTQRMKRMRENIPKAMRPDPVTEAKREFYKEILGTDELPEDIARREGAEALAKKDEEVREFMRKVEDERKRIKEETAEKAKRANAEALRKMMRPENDLVKSIAQEVVQEMRNSNHSAGMDRMKK